MRRYVRGQVAAAVGVYPVRGKPRHKLIRAHYEHRVIPGRDSYDVLDWGSREAQLARFHVLVDILLENKFPTPSEAAPSRLLDVGCGLSDLCTLLQKLKFDIDYVGVDIVPAIIKEARRRHPERKLLLADIFQEEPFQAESFSAVFCSGTFNLEMGNNDIFLLHAMDRMLPLVSDCVIVNLLHVRTAEKYDHCHYYDPDRLIPKLSPKASRIDLRDNYLENDFTLTLWG
ncbi:MAG: class I SAM-dependent methyltransferase [Lentisphaeria bacterium]